MKKLIATLLALALTLSLAGCGEKKESYARYRGSFMGTFDTMVEIIGYAESDEAFDGYLTLLKSEMERYNALFDKYHDYPGVNNIKTINDNAGIAPVEVERVVIDLLLLAREWEGKTDGTVNVAYGPVLSVWHDYRERYAGGVEGTLPSEEELAAAALWTDLAGLVIDEEASTVFLTEQGMSLDVGSIAKGYATELAGGTLYEAGCTSFILSSGGNVRIYDPPLDGERDKWGVGIQDPKVDPLAQEQTYLDTVFAKNCSVVTSGNYQRYYLVEGKKIHHVIDPATRMPADRYAAVTVVCESSGVADILSTALYILDEERGRQLAAENGAQALWIYEDGTVTYTDGMLPLLKERGGATSLIEKEKNG